ncbi:hypothetical protein ACFS6H_15285 [Terrimonas rubra]|uniref:Uncharacterized protein n=1 Tax=Terrimonas rubra TaxID=1035890 RepID=A0ABW6A6W5_9BACT
MDLVTVSLIVALLALVIAVIAIILVMQNKQASVKKQAEPVPAAGHQFTSSPLQLQAYERLVMLTERIAIPHLINRLNLSGISAAEMRALLIENTKQEYEYNSSQQIYVSQQAWEAVRNFKDQNITLINRIAGTLPPEASGYDLNKKILEALVTQNLSDVHNMVLEALNFEAKRLMK